MKLQISRTFALGLLVFAGLNLCAKGNAGADKSDAGTGEVRVRVTPEEAYIWVDDKPASHRTSTLKLTPGEHKIVVYNYGYQPQMQTVSVLAGERKEIEARLKPAEGKPVSGPWGRIQIEDTPGDALVFLNGTTPEFFVGHADEMNNEFFGDQALIVPAGKQQVHILANKTGSEIWAGTVEVRVVFDETGKVIWAKAISGHPQLRQAAEDAAWQTKFSPTILSGQPVRTSGILLYNFVP